MRTNRILLAALLPALLAGGAALAQDVPLDVEIGYRWTDVTGNDEMFRTQVDEREGFQLRSLSWGLGDIRGTNALDHFRIDAADLGIGPNGMFRLSAGRTGYWKLDATYRRSDLYSNLPTIANPFLEKGSLDSQHSYDRTRDMVDVDLELLPGKSVRPILGFSYNKMSGPGLSTYHVGQDEFKLTQDLTDKETEYRIGVAFDAGPFSGQVVQGWRQYRGTETFALAPGAGAGNEPGTVLGQPQTLSSLKRTGTTDIDTPVTSAVLTAKLGTFAKITGNFVQANADGDDASAESLAGNLISYEILRQFATLAESTSSTMETKAWRAGVRADIHIAQGFDVTAGYNHRKRALDGWALVDSLYGGVMTLPGYGSPDIRTLLESKTYMEREEDLFDVRASLKLAGPFSLRVGYAENSATIDVQNDPSEVVLVGNQGGVFDRRVRSYDGALLFSLSGLTLGVEYTRTNADNAVVRTDFLDRDRFRFRGSWAPAAWFRIGGTAEKVETSNDGVGYGLDGTAENYAGDLEIGPEWLKFRFGYGHFASDSTIPYRVPQTWATATSTQTEDGDSIEGGITLNFKPFTIEGLYRRFENDGSFAYQLDRARLRADFEFSKAVGIAAEWDLDDYSEKSRSYGSAADFRANRYGLYLRVHP
jgi:hypothetical protein